MIRKPTEKDFRESLTVTVLRETKRTAIETRNGAGHGFRAIVRFWIYVGCCFSVGITALGHMANGRIWQSLVFLGLLYGGWQLVSRIFPIIRPYLLLGQPADPEPIRPERLVEAAQSRTGQASASEAVRQSGSYTLSIPVASRQAAMLSVPGLILLFILPGLGVVFMAPGIVMFAMAALILLKAITDRELVRFDHRSITVNTLLGKGAMHWADVHTVEAHVFSRLDVKALMMLGSRRTIALTGLDDQGRPVALYIPVALLDLDEEGLTRLVADLICCRASAGAEVPAWRPAARAEPRAPVVSPAGDPRASFDPDAIMARYLAERDRTIAETRPDLPPSSPRSFGRKVV